MRTKDFYKDLIIKNAEVIAETLTSGNKAELSFSRSGLKLNAIKTKHIALNCQIENKQTREG